MAGINMAQLAGANAAKSSSSAKTAKTPGASKESSKTDFASMMQNKVDETSAGEKKEDAPVKNQTDAAEGKAPDKQQEKDTGSVKEEAGVSDAMREVQAALGQMMVQASDGNAAEPELSPGQEIQPVQVQTEEVPLVTGGGQPTSGILAGGQEAVQTGQVLAEQASEGLQDNLEAVGEAQQAQEMPAKEKAPETVQEEKTFAARGQEVRQDTAVEKLSDRKEPAHSQREDAEESGGDGRFSETGAAQEVTAPGMAEMSETQNVFRTFELPKDQTVSLKTTPETFPQDVGSKLASTLPQSNGTLTIELEPASLGKLTIRVEYEAGKAAVSIVSANSRTVELLSQNAGEIARILEEKTGQVTEVYTPDSRQPFGEGQEAGQGQERQRQEQQEHRKQEQTDSFTQMLRLGLV